MAVDMNMPILIVDDFRTMLRILEGFLRQYGFTDIDDATDGQKALELMKRKKYGLVLSDWNMEPMSGFDLLKAVRANPAIQTVPFILITAESKPDNIIAAKQAGVNNYIVKPLSAVTLKEKMSTVIGKF